MKKSIYEMNDRELCEWVHSIVREAEQEADWNRKQKELKGLCTSIDISQEKPKIFSLMPGEY